jgi:hypothetical protein
MCIQGKMQLISHIAYDYLTMEPRTISTLSAELDIRDQISNQSSAMQQTTTICCIATGLCLELKYAAYNLKKTLGLLNTDSTPRPDTDYGHNHRMD